MEMKLLLSFVTTIQGLTSALHYKNGQLYTPCYKPKSIKIKEQLTF